MFLTCAIKDMNKPIAVRLPNPAVFGPRPWSTVPGPVRHPPSTERLGGFPLGDNDKYSKNPCVCPHGCVFHVFFFMERMARITCCFETKPVFPCFLFNFFPGAVFLFLTMCQFFACDSHVFSHVLKEVKFLQPGPQFECSRYRQNRKWRWRQRGWLGEDLGCSKRSGETTENGRRCHRWNHWDGKRWWTVPLCDHPYTTTEDEAGCDHSPCRGKLVFLVHYYTTWFIIYAWPTPTWSAWWTWHRPTSATTTSPGKIWVT